MRVCGIATCDGDDVRDLLGAASSTPTTRSPCCTTRSSPAAPRAACPPASSSTSRSSSLHWCDGDGRPRFPHTLVSVGEGAEATVARPLRLAEADHLVDARHRAARRRRRARPLPLGPRARTRHLAARAPARARRTRRDRCTRRRSRSAATTRGCAASRCSTGQGGESDQLAVYFGDGDQMLDFRTLQDHDAPHTRSDLLFKGAVEDHARSVYSGLVRLRDVGAEGRTRRRPTATSCSPRARARSRSRTSRSRPTTCSARTPSTVGPIDDDQRYYLETRGIPPEEAERLIVLGFFDDVLEPAAGPHRSPRALRRSVDRQARAPARRG